MQAAATVILLIRWTVQFPIFLINSAKQSWKDPGRREGVKAAEKKKSL